MKFNKKYLIALAIVILIIVLIIVKNVGKSEPDVIINENVVEDNNTGKLEKVNVSGYHLATYNQSANANSFIKALEVNMEEKANVKFVIGTIDENNLVTERASFTLECKQGKNTFELLEKRYMIKQNEYLFMDIFGHDIVYENKEKKPNSLIQMDENKISGESPLTESQYILPFSYSLEKVEEYNGLVIGNDITIKDNKYGFSATDETKDFYALTKERLKNTFDEVNMDRINATEWETTNSANRQNWLNTNLPENKLKNLDLVIIQLGDNYPEEDDLETDIENLSKYIRNVSPNVEIIWIGMWNVRDKIYTSLPGICEKFNIEYVKINDINIEDYQTIVKEPISDSENPEIGFTVDVSYPNNEAMQVISNRIMEKLNFEF